MSEGGAARGSRPALLAVSAVAPWPVTDGYSLRAVGFLRELARSWEVTVVSPASTASPGDSEEPPAGVTRVTVPGVPCTNTLPWRPEREVLTEGVARLLGGDRSWQAALLWNGTEYLAAELPELPPAVVDRIDCETLQAWRSVRRRGGLVAGLRQLRKALDFGLYEARALRPVRAVAVTAPDDARWLRRLSRHPRIAVVPNGVSPPDLDRLPGEAPEPRVIFTGVLGYGPNVEAVRFFATRVWPAVRDRVEGARLVVAGRSPVPEIEELASATPGMELRADVEDMAAELRRAWVAVAPMRSGSGVKNKVLEAWAAGRPVVLTELATGGLDMDAGARSLVCGDARALADAVVRLLRDDPERRRLGDSARRLAEERHGWPARAAQLDGLLRNECG